jgi:hypothetical protein
LSNYSQVTFFAPKDALITGNPSKLIKGSEVDPEFLAISTAIATKADSSSATIYFADGTAGLPSITFLADTHMGFYRAGTNSLGVAINSGNVFTISTLAISFGTAVQVQAADGTVSLPGLAFNNGSSSGFYRSGTNEFSAATNGTFAARFMSTQQFATIDGAVGTPAWTFSTDPDTGAYRESANVMGLAAGGTRIVSILAGGVVVRTGGLFAQDGTGGAPSLSYDNDSDSGFFRIAANDHAVVAGGANVEEWFNNGTVTGVRFSTGLYLFNTTTPAAITGTNNNYAPASSANANRIRISSSGGATSITGLSISQLDGRRVTLYNTAATTITLNHEDAGSTAANRFNLSSASNANITQFGSITLVYDGTTSRWTAEDRS